MLLSLCTVCKNRSDHYKQTILKNIEDNKDDQNVEFVLLDYNSGDDLEEWVKHNLSEHIKSGLFSYYKTFEPEYFRRSHSRNMVFRLAKGELLCNVDADNYTGLSFSTYLRNQFATNPEQVFVCAGGQFDSISCSDIGGRICVSSSDFRKVGGYDESMSNYGVEDFDLINRLELLKLKKVIISRKEHLNVIKHAVVNRINEEFPYRNLNQILVSYINPFTSKLLFLFLDNTYALGTVIKAKGINSEDKLTRFQSRNDNPIAIAEGNWIKGSLEYRGPDIFNLQQENSVANYRVEKRDTHLKMFSDEIAYDFYPVNGQTMIETAILFYSEIQNKIKMDHNARIEIINPNSGSIGSGIVYKNFDYDNPIAI